MLKKLTILAFVSMIVLVGPAAGQPTGKNPVIIIPGVSGSTLVNSRTGKTVWFNVKRDKDDDLRLPMLSPVLSRNRDDLRATDIIREVKLPVLPDIEVYQSLIDALKERGYTEADWNKPKAADVFYVFPYDWRRDNVETAHLLIRQMAAVKRGLRKPDLQFDIIAHSMGGLVARYAAMYGTSQPPAGRPVPNWSGAAHIHRLMMFGTPNEGAYDSIDALLNGYPIVANRKLPLIDDLRPEDVMTAPSVFQLMPHPSPRILDNNLSPVNIDLYDIETWIKYGWGAITDPKFLGKLRDAPRLAVRNREIKPEKITTSSSNEDRLVARLTYAQVKAYMTAALTRARNFHRALDAPSSKIPIQIYAYGGNCEKTLDAVLLFRDGSKDRWVTLFEAKDIKSPSGAEIKKEVVRDAMFADGDGRVTRRSLLAESEPSGPESTKKIPFNSSFLACGSHTKLFLEKSIQDSFFSTLVVEQRQQP